MLPEPPFVYAGHDFGEKPCLTLSRTGRDAPCVCRATWRKAGSLQERQTGVTFSDFRWRKSARRMVGFACGSACLLAGAGRGGEQRLRFESGAYDWCDRGRESLRACKIAV